MNVILGTALVDMYVKCGNTAILGGLAHHGYAQDALSCYHEMIRAGLVPD